LVKENKVRAQKPLICYFQSVKGHNSGTIKGINFKPFGKGKQKLEHGNQNHMVRKTDNRNNVVFFVGT